MKIKIVKTADLQYVDRDGAEQSKRFASRMNGKLAKKDGGSFFLAMLTLLIAFGEKGGVIKLEGIKARVTVAGDFVLEPSIRGAEWFAKDEDVARTGSFAWDLIGEAREELNEAVLAHFPNLRKRLATAQAAHAKAAAA